MMQNIETFEEIISFIRNKFGTSDGFIALHEPRFNGNERKYVVDAIDSTFVSSVGAYVDKFEEMIAQITGAKYAIATVNGTAALHVSLLLAGVSSGDEVITQPVCFIATANAISYVGASPVFVDVDSDTLGLSPEKLLIFLKEFGEIRANSCYNKSTGNKIAACVPMHTFGFPSRIEEILTICKHYHIPVVEDAAESLGSKVNGRHTGTFGLLGIFSFNGNKTVTCGGGGAIITDNESLAKLAKHITTTAKVPHKWEYVHDMVGYNYRMPNLNAALACAQLEQLELFINRKRMLANHYKDFFEKKGIPFYTELPGTFANYWLMAIAFSDLRERNRFLEFSNSHKVMTRPLWKLTCDLAMYKNCYFSDLSNARWAEERVVNIPSSVII